MKDFDLNRWLQFENDEEIDRSALARLLHQFATNPNDNNNWPMRQYQMFADVHGDLDKVEVVPKNCMADNQDD